MVVIQASRECVYSISKSTSCTVIGSAGAALARRGDGRVRVPTSPVVSVTERLPGWVTSQESEVTIVVVLKAWRVPMCVSCGWVLVEEVGDEVAVAAAVAEAGESR